MKKTPGKASPKLAAALSPSRRKETLRAMRQEDVRVLSEAVAASIAVESDPDRADGYILREGGRVISRWREASAPGLAAWLMTRMHERHSAIPLARAEAARLGQSAARGKMSGRARDPTAKHPGLSRQIRLCIERREDPRQYAGEWASSYGLGKSTVYDLIRRIQK